MVPRQPAQKVGRVVLSVFQIRAYGTVFLPWPPRLPVLNLRRRKLGAHRELVKPEEIRLPGIFQLSNFWSYFNNLDR
jgi:hypothetical protein